MSLSATIVFVAAIAVVMATPGPSVVTLVARVLAMGRGGTNPAFAAGLILGDIFWFACAVFGIAAIAAEAHEVMIALKYLGAAYLVYAGYRLWTAPSDAVEAVRVPPRARPVGAFIGGFSLALANPKTMMFYLALLPNIIDLAAVTAIVFVELAVLSILIYSAVLSAYMLGVRRARRLLASPTARRAVNRGSGTVMVGTAIFVAMRP